ncbi:CheY-like chemotaxis protein [Litorivivens lipolytica]|uniref:CheY-like chemotaxis protein n=1 Tax=Litorivivens lipolytica TaxID=1524264 RepID=A0A7W4W4A7_9GAMM|nr:CheY-like chemotaxis protein [Litorivivens lipolytica]
MTQRILIAEDDEVNQNILMRQLKRFGYSADLAEDGSKALALWKEQAYDLVITDLHMPNMDGYDLCKAIRELEKTDNRPRTAVVMLTANAFGEAQNDIQASGIDDFLTKPLRLPEIKQALEKWL